MGVLKLTSYRLYISPEKKVSEGDLGRSRAAFVVCVCLLSISQRLSKQGQPGEEVARWCHAGGLVEVACFSVSAGYLKVFDLGTGIGDVGARRR